MARAVVAAEDANFCRHWGVDLDAVRDVIESGSARGASTISQQVAKNVFLWHQRSFLRKGLAPFRGVCKGYQSGTSVSVGGCFA